MTKTYSAISPSHQGNLIGRFMCFEFGSLEFVWNLMLGVWNLYSRFKVLEFSAKNLLKCQSL